MKAAINQTLKRGNRFRRAKRKAWLLNQREKNLWRKNRYKRTKPSGFKPSHGLHLNSHTKKSISHDKEHKITILMPERLDFESNYEETVSHFAVLREAVQKGKRVSNLNFSRIRQISTSAALVLASEVDRWNQRLSGKLHANLPSWDEGIKRLLCQMGYFELLNLEKPQIPWPESNITFLPFKRGQVSEKDGGQLAKQLRIEIENMVGQKIKKHFLFEGLSEAITNVGQHAYRDDGDYCKKQWWVSASFDAGNRKLCVTFYDQGHGIPYTLPRSKFFELMKDAFNKWHDSEKIKAAMEIGRTSSGLAERGKGLQNLIEFAKAHRNGSLSIYSLKGVFMQRFTDGDSKPTELIIRDYENSIGGTLIEWSVDL